MKEFFANGSSFFAETQTYLQYRTEGYSTIHFHDYWECFVLLDGQALHNTNNGSKAITKGHVSLLHPQNAHSIIPTDSNFAELTFSVKCGVIEHLCNMIHPDFYSRLNDIKSTIDFYLDDSRYDLIKQKLNIYLSLESENQLAIAALVKMLLMNILEVIFLELIHSNSSYPDWLNKFITILKRPEHVHLKIEDVFGFSNFSHSHLTRLFKKLTGKTLITAFKEIKLSHAAMLLKATNQTILNISGAIGYSSLSNFNKSFKEFYAVTPSEYRKNA